MQQIKEKVLVTGARGFLGRYICRKLIDKGYDVWGFSRTKDEALVKYGVKWIEGDICNYQEIESAVSGKKGVFHIASKVGMWGDYQDFFETNVIGTRNVINACISKKISKLVYTSTPSVVFGKDDLCGVDESTPYPKKYLTHYASTKAIAEREVLRANGQSELVTCALRPHLIYGKDDPNLIPRLVKAAKENRLRIVGNGTNLIDVIHVENAADSHIKAYQILEHGSRNEGKAYFIGQETPVNCWEFINELLVRNGAPKVTKSISLSTLYTIGMIIEFIFKLFRIKKIEPPMTSFVALQLGKSHFFDQSAAKKDFGHNPKITIEQSLELF